MSFPESPALTDAEKIIAGQEMILANQEIIIGRLNAHADGINKIGANMQWLVENVQGIFQMFMSPMFAEQMAQMLGGITGGGQAGPAADESGPAGDGGNGSGESILDEVPH